MCYLIDMNISMHDCFMFSQFTACGCDTDGTTLINNVPNEVCHKETGQCDCEDSIKGRTCDQCKPGFYDFPTGEAGRVCITRV